jgi:hypothetical protein
MMENRLDKRIWLLLVLVVLAAVLVVINDKRGTISSKAGAVLEAMGSGQMQNAIQHIVDSTLQKMGAVKIRRTKVIVDDKTSSRIEVKAEMPPRFETIRLLTALKDSLARFGVRVAATENLRDATSSVHLIDHQQVFESIIISREMKHAAAGDKVQKGVSPLVSRKRKAVPHKVR